jgi:isoleucyl-tRNA synthetase
LIAPFTPFLAEYIHRCLAVAGCESHQSVHLAPFPKAEFDWINPALEESVSFAREIVSAGLRLRKQLGIKARFPLSEVGWIPKQNSASLTEEMKISVMEELNVKTMTLFKDERDKIHFDVKPNLPVLGKKYGPLLPSIKKTLAEIDPISDWVSVLLSKGEQPLSVSKETIRIIPEDVLIMVQGIGDWAATEIEQAYVVINQQQSEALMEEGIVREVIHAIQQTRKNMQFSVTDRIHVDWLAQEQSARLAIERGAEEICSEVLADSLSTLDEAAKESVQELDLPYQYGRIAFTIRLSGKASTATGPQ